MFVRKVSRNKLPCRIALDGNFLIKCELFELNSTEQIMASGGMTFMGDFLGVLTFILTSENDLGLYQELFLNARTINMALPLHVEIDLSGVKRFENVGPVKGLGYKMFEKAAYYPSLSYLVSDFSTSTEKTINTALLRMALPTEMHYLISEYQGVIKNYNKNLEELKQADKQLNIWIEAYHKHVNMHPGPRDLPVDVDTILNTALKQKAFEEEYIFSIFKSSKKTSDALNNCINVEETYKQFELQLLQACELKTHTMIEECNTVLPTQELYTLFLESCQEIANAGDEVPSIITRWANFLAMNTALNSHTNYTSHYINNPLINANQNQTIEKKLTKPLVPCWSQQDNLINK